ncbi:MAG: hypothetical protein LUE17_09590 [Planctomycetaceae bacterium]|nr:hypothetical protein [Planctomycetaceae bacterium]
MLVECLERHGARDSLQVLADFLRTPLARLRYGQATIYTGDVYCLPYYAVTIRPPREREFCLFLGSALRDDVAVCRLDRAMRLETRECDPGLVLEPRKDAPQVGREIAAKIKTNRRLRRAFGPGVTDGSPLRLLHVPTPSFLVRCRRYALFLVDPLTEKVDFRHLSAVEDRFVAPQPALAGA